MFNDHKLRELELNSHMRKKLSLSVDTCSDWVNQFEMIPILLMRFRIALLLRCGCVFSIPQPLLKVNLIWIIGQRLRMAVQLNNLGEGVSPEMGRHLLAKRTPAPHAQSNIT